MIDTQRASNDVIFKSQMTDVRFNTQMLLALRVFSEVYCNDCRRYAMEAPRSKRRAARDLQITPKAGCNKNPRVRVELPIGRQFEKSMTGVTGKLSQRVSPVVTELR